MLYYPADELAEVRHTWQEIEPTSLQKVNPPKKPQSSDQNTKINQQDLGLA